MYLVVNVLNNIWGGLQVKFYKNVEGALSLLVAWDNESFELKITRVKLEFTEHVPGGRSLSQSFTFEDSSAKKKSFLLALNLPENELKMLSDSGAEIDARALQRSSVSIEVETLDGETRRFKIAKKKIQAALAQASFSSPEIEEITDKNPDSWSVQTRVFPWKKKAEAEGDEEAPAKKVVGGGPAAPRAEVNFNVTKVWIEPGCIVCDACENEAPAVFWVTGDTCIVRENAPLDDAAAIKAAAEGCPVDVIKYTKVPKVA